MGSLSILKINDGDKKTLLALLNRVPVTGLDEARTLISYAKAIQDAPPEPAEPMEPLVTPRERTAPTNPKA